MPSPSSACTKTSGREHNRYKRDFCPRMAIMATVGWAREPGQRAHWKHGWAVEELVVRHGSKPRETCPARVDEMRIAIGKVIHGKLELDADTLEGGSIVTVLVPEPDETFE